MDGTKHGILMGDLHRIIGDSDAEIGQFDCSIILDQDVL